MHRFVRVVLAGSLATTLFGPVPNAQPVFRGDEIFPPEEFAARRAKLVAPDYKYYQSDVTRVFPANGTFTPGQREYYEIYLRLYQALMTSIEVHKRPIGVMANAVKKMDAIVASYEFTDARIKAAAVKFVDGFRARRQANGLGHNVGLEVHDPGGLQAETLEPGRIFTIEPQFRLEEESLGVRLEDMILITETGYENLSQFVPIEVKAIEKLMSARGLSDALIRPAVVK